MCAKPNRSETKKYALMIKIIYLGLFLPIIMLSSGLCAQPGQQKPMSRPLHVISLSALGDASIFAINFERLFMVDSTFMVAARIGAGFNQEFRLCVWGPCTPPSTYFTLPVHTTINFGRKRNFAEAGFGATIINGNTNQHLFFYPIFGYRLHPFVSGRISVRVYFEWPFRETEDILFIPLGFSLGISL